MNVVACYPRSMSAWLSGFITIPGHSIYLHDISYFPDTVKALETSEYKYKGFVDTAVTVDNLPSCNLTIIDNNVDRVREKVIRFIGDDSSVGRRNQEIEDLKNHGVVLNFDDMDKWIEEFFYKHTGLELDWVYYRTMKNLNIQAQSAKNLMEKQ